MTLRKTCQIDIRLKCSLLSFFFFFIRATIGVDDIRRHSSSFFVVVVLLTMSMLIWVILYWSIIVHSWPHMQVVIVSHHYSHMPIWSIHLWPVLFTFSLFFVCHYHHVVWHLNIIFSFPFYNRLHRTESKVNLSFPL